MSLLNEVHNDCLRCTYWKFLAYRFRKVFRIKYVLMPHNYQRCHGDDGNHCSRNEQFPIHHGVLVLVEVANGRRVAALARASARTWPSREARVRPQRAARVGAMSAGVTGWKYWPGWMPKPISRTGTCWS